MWFRVRGHYCHIKQAEVERFNLSNKDAQMNAR